MHRAQMRHSGFTLIELLVAVGVIAILVSIALVAGNSVVQASRASLTKDTLTSMTEVLEVYMNERGAIPPGYVQDPRGTSGLDVNVLWPVADARTNERMRALDLDEATSLPGFEALPVRRNRQLINSAGLFAEQTKDVPDAEGRLSGLPSDVVRSYSVASQPNRFANASGSDGDQPDLPTPFDAWGRPIRYVHPAFDGLLVESGSEPWRASATSDGVQVDTIRGLKGVGDSGPEQVWALNSIRRNNYASYAPADPNDLPEFRDELPDSDGGFCPGNRPYFYSAGPDGDPSTISDNVYITVPEIDIPGV